MKRLITSALPYVNNKPHMGNLIGSILPADIFSRFSRNQGKKVLFVCGSDEYGTPITITAKKLGKTPKEVCDMFYSDHKRIYEWFDIGFDVFSRTSNEAHNKMTQEIFTEIYKNNYITEKTEDAFFCEKDNMFLPDRYVEGVCPECGKIARGDQCDCGYVLKSTLELKDPYCVFCKSKPVIKKTKHLFFDYSKLEQPLDKWITAKEKDWNPLTVSIARSWLQRGLKSRAITRDLEWGVKVPLPDYDNKVFYVWFDAPIGYISFVSQATDNIADWWGKKSDAKIYHFLGKDNVPFHTIFWPATLLAAGKYKLPDYVVGMSYLNCSGKKISKSLGYGFFCEDAINSGLSSDIWRFYLSNVLPMTSDSEWNEDELVQITNTILVSNISNLYYRVMTFAQKNYELLPRPNLDAIDKEYLIKRSELISKYEKEMDAVRLKEGLKVAIEFASLTNKYFQEKAPWQEKENQTTIYVSLNLCIDLALLLEPFIPNFSQKVFNLFGVEKPYLINYLDINFFILRPGFEIPKVKIPMFFTRIEPKDPVEEPKKEEKKVAPKVEAKKVVPKVEVKVKTTKIKELKKTGPKSKVKVADKNLVTIKKEKPKKKEAKKEIKKVVPKKKVTVVTKKKVISVKKIKPVAKPKIKPKAKPKVKAKVVKAIKKVPVKKKIVIKNTKTKAVTKPKQKKAINKKPISKPVKKQVKAKLQKPVPKKGSMVSKLKQTMQKLVKSKPKRK